MKELKVGDEQWTAEEWWNFMKKSKGYSDDKHDAFIEGFNILSNDYKELLEDYGKWHDRCIELEATFQKMKNCNNCDKRYYCSESAGKACGNWGMKK